MLEVKLTAGGGRSYFATEYIPANTLILIDNPTVAAIYDDFKKEVCVYCYEYNGGTNLKFVVGKSSRACSKACRDAFLALPFAGELQHLWDIIQETKKSLGNAINFDMLRFCASAVVVADYQPLEFAELLYLQDDYAMATASELDSEIGVCKALREILPDSEIPLETIIRQMLGRSKCNCFGIWEQEDGSSFPESEMFGYSLYARSSFFNHACQPNVSKCRVRREMQFTTLVEVHPGEELVISYLGDREHKTRKERQKALREWGFHCACRLCLEESSIDM